MRRKTPAGKGRFSPVSARLKRIPLNLPSNAVKFTPEGGEVLLAARLGDDGSMIVTVTDSSAGTTVILRLPAERIIPETR